MRRFRAFVDAAKAAGSHHAVRQYRARPLAEIHLPLGTSGATAITRNAQGPVLADPDTRALFRNIMRETLAVGRAKGVALDARYTEERMAFADKNLVPA